VAGESGAFTLHTGNGLHLYPVASAERAPRSCARNLIREPQDEVRWKLVREFLEEHAPLLGVSSASKPQLPRA
jgi:hypothetical protein